MLLYKPLTIEPATTAAEAQRGAVTAAPEETNAAAAAVYAALAAIAPVATASSPPAVFLATVQTNFSPSISLFISLTPGQRT